MFIVTAYTWGTFMFIVTAYILRCSYVKSNSIHIEVHLLSL